MMWTLLLTKLSASHGRSTKTDQQHKQSLNTEVASLRFSNASDTSLAGEHPALFELLSAEVGILRMVYLALVDPHQASAAAPLAPTRGIDSQTCNSRSIQKKRAHWHRHTLSAGFKADLKIASSTSLAQVHTSYEGHAYM